MKRIQRHELVFMKKDKKYGFVRYVGKEGSLTYVCVEDAFGNGTCCFLNELIRMPAEPKELNK